MIIHKHLSKGVYHSAPLHNYNLCIQVIKNFNINFNNTINIHQIALHARKRFPTLYETYVFVFLFAMFYIETLFTVLYWNFIYCFILKLYLLCFILKLSWIYK